MSKNSQPKKQKVKKITATYARNNFFGLVQDAYLNNTQYAIEKNGILMGYIVSPQNFSSIDEEAQQEARIKKQLAALDRLAELRKLMPNTGNSVDLIREMREERMKKFE